MVLMVKIKITRSSSNEIRSICASGHAGFAEHGSDIVCSAVSVLMQTAALGLERLGAEAGFYSVSDGRMKIFMPVLESVQDRDKASFLMETVSEAFFEIEKSYRGFIRVSSCNESR